MLEPGTVTIRVPAAAGTDLGLLDSMIASAQGYIEQQTGRYFGPPMSQTEYLPGTGDVILSLPDKLQTGTPTVTERTTPTAAETAVTAFEVRQGRAATDLLRTDGLRWVLGYEYKVVYTRGYVIDRGPEDILRLALGLIALQLSTEGLEGLRSGSVGAFSFTRGGFEDSDLNQIQGGASTIRAWRRLVYA